MTDVDNPNHSAGMTVAIVSTWVYWHQKNNSLISMSANYSGFKQNSVAVGLSTAKGAPEPGSEIDYEWD